MVEQIFKEKFSTKENTEQQLLEIMNEAYPLIQKNTTRKVLCYTDCFDELVRLIGTDANPDKIFQTMDVDVEKFNKTNEFQKDKKALMNNEHQDAPEEINSYLHVINLLRTDLAKHKTMLEHMTVENRNRQNSIDSLRSEITGYKTKINNMQTEIMKFHNITNSIKKEFTRFKIHLSLMILKQDDVYK